jgi:histidinol-phosphate aminotransferase
MGFEVLPSLANFVFARHPLMGGEVLYLGLKKRGILVRHFNGQRTKDFIRISIGTKEQMTALTGHLQEILGGQKP